MDTEFMLGNHMYEGKKDKSVHACVCGRDCKRRYL